MWRGEDEGTVGVNALCVGVLSTPRLAGRQAGREGGREVRAQRALCVFVRSLFQKKEGINAGPESDITLTL